MGFYLSRSEQLLLGLFMDQLQNHIITLEQKVDRLYAVVKHLNNRFEETTEMRNGGSNHSENIAVNESSPEEHHRSFRAMMGHKDILLDDDTNTGGNRASDGEEVSPEIQIRRLNTQLAAAYNRIAALEEQLLAQRIHF